MVLGDDSAGVELDDAERAAVAAQDAYRDAVPDTARFELAEIVEAARGGIIATNRAAARGGLLATSARSTSSSGRRA
jgi:hypothetical protein